MKRILSIALLCAATLGLFAQKQEIIKTGWNFGPLPVVGWDSDLGFQYGACVDIFNYGDGSSYPSYDYKMNLEASTFTGGSSVLRCYGDFKTLIPEGKLFFDCTYFNAKKFDFFGFNGYASPYNPNFLLSANPLEMLGDNTSAFNWMKRSQFRLVTSVQRRITGNLYWAAGFGYYNIKTGRVKIDGYEDQITLYDLYRQTNLIRDNEANGGNVLQLRAGLVYDTRDHDSDPTRGVNVEATLVGAPDIIDRKGYSNLGFTFVGSQYVPVYKDKLTFAYRIGIQTKLAGEIPYYFINNLNTLFFRKVYTEGLGGNASVRGINRNGVVGNGMAWLNTEFRWRIVNFRFINQNFHVALNPFFDMGWVTQPYRLDEQKAAYEMTGGQYNPLNKYNPFYSGNEEKVHMTAGCGLKVVMNRNFVVSVEMARALDKRDGQKLWNNIGFNYLF
ncbi:MAG: BamA/TamA family outer membrane protein [Bacteroidaceae bacterium]|nr:BamA/TamA family outer membrane protein [Bacteroidaceae bacterium]